MKILVIDNNIDQDSWGAREIRALAARGGKGTVYVRRGPHEDLPRSAQNFDRVIISGSKSACFEDSPWVLKLDTLIRETLNLKKPMLGICYGHQAIARVLGGAGSLGRSAKPEVGWTRIEQTAKSSLLAGLPQTFYSFSLHFEEVASLPPGTRQIARSDWCEQQAFEVENHPVFGIQFHPERGLEGAEKTLAARKKSGEPKELLNPNLGEKLYDPGIGQKIFYNFLGL